MIYSLEIDKKKNKFLEKVYEDSMRDLEKFFKLKWKINRPNVFIIPSKKMRNYIRGENVPEWVVGWINGKDVYMLDKKECEKCHNCKYIKERYSALLKHELVHTFTRIITKKKKKPYWLWEGIAIYLSGQTKIKKKPKKLNKFLECDEKYGPGLYQESGFAIEFLAKKYGKTKLLNLIKVSKEIKSKQQFEKKFKEIYGFNLNYKNFN
ncbi:hypothetical protein HOG16_01595 [Candidatus Woesearchaeota archaeon]|jgi:hypothetical protein|nr:hypothetical protein [Candidatus Woesearchaeota archaeon]MBT4322268.1 hypothetical protein [Candidatus Woesearchaeota archaeon]